MAKLEMYATSFFASIFGTLADLYLDVKFDLYSFFDKGVDCCYIPILLFIYPAFNILFLNFYPDHKPIFQKGLYILGFSVLTIVFEYIALHTQVLYYNELENLVFSHLLSIYFFNTSFKFSPNTRRH